MSRPLVIWGHLELAVIVRSRLHLCVALAAALVGQLHVRAYYLQFLPAIGANVLSACVIALTLDVNYAASDLRDADGEQVVVGIPCLGVLGPRGRPRRGFLVHSPLGPGADLRLARSLHFACHCMLWSTRQRAGAVHRRAHVLVQQDCLPIVGAVVWRSAVQGVRVVVHLVLDSSGAATAPPVGLPVTPLGAFSVLVISIALRCLGGLALLLPSARLCWLSLRCRLMVNIPLDLRDLQLGYDDLVVSEWFLFRLRGGAGIAGIRLLVMRWLSLTTRPRSGLLLSGESVLLACACLPQDRLFRADLLDRLLRRSLVSQEFVYSFW